MQMTVAAAAAAQLLSFLSIALAVISLGGSVISAVTRLFIHLWFLLDACSDTDMDTVSTGPSRLNVSCTHHELGR